MEQQKPYDISSVLYVTIMVIVFILSI